MLSERKDLLTYDYYSKISSIVFSGAVDDEKLPNGKMFYFASLS